MSQQEFSRSSERESEPLPEAPVPAAPQVSTQGVDDLLDEIDSILETNAESFVQGFVQKGGQ
ncbi:MAG: ubiquitin-like protein Pup [bacterium]|nr:ubiquitin-like protein Pup [bacterium]